MSEPEIDLNHEQRINDLVVVDCYDDSEVFAGWYVYLTENLEFPFTADYRTKITAPDKTTPVTVVGMVDMDECEGGMLCYVDYESAVFAVPLSEISNPKADLETRQAIADWHYWCDDQGPSFSEW
ncbi:MAG: calcium-binding protein [Cyanobacteria bacterium P01_H01_bin.15]